MEQDKENLGGINLGGPDPSGNTPDASLASTSASAETIRTRKQRSDAGVARKPREGQPSASVPPISQTMFAKLYDPDIWQRALCAPADFMAATSGRKHWEVSTQERQAVGATCSIAAQCFAVADPRWLALAIAGITVLDVYGLRLLMDLQEKKKEEEARKKAQAQRT